MISRYRMALMQVVDLCCILLALAVSGMVTIAPDLSVFDDYTGASLFTIFFYLLFFYILDAYSVGMEDFKDTLGRILVACVLGIISSATASFALENWRFDRVTVLLLFALDTSARGSERLLHPFALIGGECALERWEAFRRCFFQQRSYLRYRSHALSFSQLAEQCTLRRRTLG